MEKNKKRNKTQKKIIAFSIVISVVLIAGFFFVIKTLVTEDVTKKKRQIQMVTLLNPPPPSKVEEIPPEPELKEKEEIIEAVEEMHEEIPDDGSDQEAGSDLGVDADGVAGADGFGLVSKKGGKALIGDGAGNEGLLKKFSWYTQMLQGLIQERLQKELEKNGGIPEGNHEATVRVVLDDAGTIVTCQIVGSSGNQGMDRAISEAARRVKADDPPPFDMPKAIKLRVSSKG